MLSVYLYLHFRQSLISVAVCISEYRHWKGKGFRAEYSRRRKIQTETACRPDLSTFKGWCTTFADEQRKGANDGIGKLIYRRLMIDQFQILPCNNENVPPFCSFIKKLYLCSKMSCTSMQITQVCRNQNSCQLITSFLNFPHKLFILSGLWDYSKNTDCFWHYHFQIDYLCH